MRRRPATLFGRLLLLTLPVEAAVLAIFGVWLVRGAEARALEAVDLGLRAQRADLLSHLVLNSDGGLGAALEARVLAPETEGCLLDGRGRVLWEHPRGWLAASGLRPSSREAMEVLMTVPMAGGAFRVLDAGVRLREPGDTEVSTGPLVEAVLARPLADIQAADTGFRRRAVAVGAALLILTGILLWAALRLGLRPIGEAAARLGRIPGAAGTERLDIGAIPSELRPLASAINDLLDRLWGLVEIETRHAAEAAHELRTPVTLVKSTLQTALLTAVTPEEKEAALREALEDLERLEGTAEDLLERSRPGADGAVPSEAFEPVDLPRLLSTVAGRFEAPARDRSLGLTLRCLPCAVRGDGHALERLAAILVDNAVKYSAPGGVIRLSCGAADGRAELSVEDEGPPIADADRPHLFKRFFRGGAGASPASPGSGLGLAIALEIARQHEAVLFHEVAPGGGNRFRVVFSGGRGDC